MKFQMAESRYLLSAISIFYPTAIVVIISFRLIFDFMTSSGTAFVLTYADFAISDKHISTVGLPQNVASNQTG